MTWEKCKFSQLYAEPSKNGLSRTSDIQSDGVKIINMGEIFSCGFVGFQPMRRAKVTENELKNFSVQNHDLLFARRSLVESGAGKVSIVKSLTEDTVFESSIIRVRLDEKISNPLFYYYWLSSPKGRGIISSLVCGTNVKGIRSSELKEIEVDYPDLQTQKKLASILNTYDALIENNQKQIKLMEEAAQRLYKEWFVDLHFPGYETTKIIDGVPEGWEITTVESLLQKIPRVKHINTSEYLKNGKIPVIDQSREFIAGYTNDYASIVNYEVPVIVFGDHTRIIKYIQFPFASGADGTQLIISNNPSMPQSLLYHGLINADLSDYHYARHFKYLKEMKILVPIQDIADKFDAICSKLHQQIQQLRDMSFNLMEARNRLLPKLMSGEIEIL